MQFARSTASHNPTPIQVQSDEQLMLAYGQGEIQAFSQLYTKHKDPLWRFFIRRGMPTDCAEELMQEVWQRVIQSAAHYQANARFTTWLYQIARNLLIDKHRLAHRQFKLVTEHFDDEDCSANEPEQLVQSARQAQKLRKCLAKLPALQLDTFLLKEEAGLKLDQIAQVMDSAVEACKSRMRYAVANLIACLGKHGEKS
ncbi:ECF family RNA polymerase sigma factor SbrI [Bowmanella denitrificans]|uniref:ECF family RNA polymerase sigma factor SbrI n=1 Tax=Bowmanella denitrificans TaxID=366582 RepID=A0ABN0WRK1_9ALTE